MRRIIFFAIICFAFQPVSAQSFVGEATLSPVDKDGFYRIIASPDLNTYLKNDFSNLRIYDQDQKEVAFLFQEEIAHLVTQNFREYEILEKKYEKDCCTSLLLHNPDQRLSNNINLIIRNADVTKEAVLLGSDDKEHWFALKQHVVLDPVRNAQGSTEIKIVDFPLSNYNYYSLRINDSTSAPLNILNAGYFEVQAEPGKYEEVPSLKTDISENAKEKRSYLRLAFDTTRIVDKLEISMKGSPYFLRKARLYEPRERTVKKGRKESFLEFIMDAEISSRRITSLELPALKTKELLLIIENEDSPALEENSVKTFQLNRYFTAWLEKNKSYVIKIGDDRQKKPVYDLSFFRDSIPQEPAVLRAGPVKLFTTNTTAQNFTLFNSRMYIWAAVVLVIVVLGFMSLKMLREMGVKKE